MNTKLWITCILLLMRPAMSYGQNSELPAFINPQYNLIEFKDSSEFNKVVWGLGKASLHGYSVAHFGDSHVQPDYSASEIRKILQSTAGDGGRGLIFPYSIAKTYSQYDYKSTYTGIWETANSMHVVPRIPLGISGFVARTYDTAASFKIIFTKPLPPGPKSFTMIADNPENGYSIKWMVNGMLALETLPNENKGVYRFRHDQSFDTLTIQIERKNQTDTPFQIFGINIESDKPGVIYHNLGVGGARFDAILQQKLFINQIDIIKPDLFILDWGTNDIIAGNAVPENLKGTIVKTIELIREKYPKAAILLTTVQDMNRKGKNITSAKNFSKMIREVAWTNNCLLYDWYRIAGGTRSMKKWVASQYAQKDNIHLSVKGYRLKGNLMCQAILHSIDSLQKSEGTLVNIELSNHPEIEAAQTEPIKKEQSAKSTPKKKTYVVKSGDSLWSIANKNNISVATLKKLNGLKNDKILPGQRLIIRK